jgi:hypothetical protein
LAASFISDGACDDRFWHLASIRTDASNGPYGMHSGLCSLLAQNGLVAYTTSKLRCEQLFNRVLELILRVRLRKEVC